MFPSARNLHPLTLPMCRSVPPPAGNRTNQFEFSNEEPCVKDDVSTPPGGRGAGRGANPHTDTPPVGGGRGGRGGSAPRRGRRGGLFRFEFSFGRPCLCNRVSVRTACTTLDYARNGVLAGCGSRIFGRSTQFVRRVEPDDQGFANLYEIVAGVRLAGTAHGQECWQAIKVAQNGGSLAAETATSASR
jgi:hypothetical protein